MAAKREERDSMKAGGAAKSPSGEPEPVRRVRIPSMGSIGYTGTYREPSVDIVDVSVVSVLEARGPE
jgi:hypothetical protein